MRYFTLSAAYSILNLADRCGLLPRAVQAWHTSLALRLDLMENPITEVLNRSLVRNGGPRKLKLWERVLLELGF